MRRTAGEGAISSPRGGERVSCDVRASATIEHGVKTNRVRVSRRPKQDPSPQRAVRRYKSAGSLGPGPGTVVAVSLSAADLAAMDELAEHMGMSRSHLIREAVKAFGKQVKP